MRQLITLLFLIPFLGNSQDYFQQEVNYIIDVTLDDTKHQLRGHEEFEYINKSPNELNKIYIHLWPNAYKSGETALAKQQYSQDDDDLKYGPDSLKGNIEGLDFKLNHQSIKWEYDAENPDICVLYLPVPMKTGDRVSISTPFIVNLPNGSVSRLGHVGQSYQITQWYPKPAVYDKDGWHPIPYLNQGEFYSEYGSFDVRITLPENYVVGATGDLQTKSEIEFLNELAEETEAEIDNLSSEKRPSNKFPPSSEKMKTIRYKQKNVHDFAWFADKRYKVLKGEVELPHSGRKVTTWAMFTPRNSRLWSKAIEYINDGTYYYSKWNGDYPYNQVTAVDGTISAGGGMEYPNVTVIGNTGNAELLEVVIVHEVGHNWFYGQLGSNERVHGWMDEGMNTHNEVRYMQTKYPNNTAMSNMVLNGSFHFNDLDHHDMNDIAYRSIAQFGEDQAIETHTADFTSTNYGIIMYQKTGLVFHYLMDYLGEEKFDECMQEYYRQWEFKHPQPEDMRATLESCSGKDLSWLFDDLIQTTHQIDYKISGIKKDENGITVNVKNVGQVNGPIPVALVNEIGELIEEKWIEPTLDRKASVHFNSAEGNIVIDYNKHVPEINRGNNSYKTSGLFKSIEKPKMEFLIGDNEREASNNFWSPAFGANTYDKFMLGAAFHNFGIAPGKFQYLAVPMYSFGRKMISGFGDMGLVYHPKNNFKLSRFGLMAKSFKHDSTFVGNESYFIAIQPYWFAKIGNKNKKAVNYYQSIRVQSMYRKDQFGPTHFEHAGAYAEYKYNFDKPDHKAEVKIRNTFLTNVNNSDQFGRATIEGKYEFRYLRKKQSKSIEVRGFFGSQYLNEIKANSSPYGQFANYQYAMSLSGANGGQDFFIDEFYFGRNESREVWSQQRNDNWGGFRSTSSFGTTDQWMTAGNIWLQLPYIPKLIGVFADFGAFYNGYEVQTAFNSGVGLRLSNSFGVYFPIYMSENLNNSYISDNYFEKVRLTMKFNILNNTPLIGKILN